MVIAVVNNKGGVGKTTTSVNLAAALAASGRRSLLVDLDSQASASAWCGIPQGRLKPSTANCMLNGFPVTRAIRKTSTPRLDLLTGSMELANADLALCDTVGRELVLAQLLESLRSTYDSLVVDCPPGMSLLTVNALMAADALIIPVMPRHLAVQALVGLTSSVEKTRTKLGSRSKLLGLLLVMVEGRGRREGMLRDRLRAKFDDQLFQTEIPSSAVVEDCAAVSQTVLHFAPRSACADAFRRLAREVLDRAQPALARV